MLYNYSCNQSYTIQVVQLFFLITEKNFTCETVFLLSIITSICYGWCLPSHHPPDFASLCFHPSIIFWVVLPFSSPLGSVLLFFLSICCYHFFLHAYVFYLNLCSFTYIFNLDFLCAVEKCWKQMKGKFGSSCWPGIHFCKGLVKSEWNIFRSHTESPAGKNGHLNIKSTYLEFQIKNEKSYWRKCFMKLLSWTQVSEWHKRGLAKVLGKRLGTIAQTILKNW